MTEHDRREHERVLREAALRGEDSLNQLDKWRLKQARAEEARVAQHRAERRTEERRRERDWITKSAQDSEIEALRAELRQAIADVNAKIEYQHEVILEAVGEALGQVSNKTCEWAEKLIHELKNEMITSVARVHGEMMGRIDNLLPEPRAREKSEFKFASERDDGDILNDLPKPGDIVRKTKLN